MAQLDEIWLKRAHTGPMDVAERATLVVDVGLEGNTEQGGKRQVTIISRERWAAAEAALSAEVEPSLRRANLLVSGVDLEDSRGKVLCIGNCRIAIRGETRPCELMDKQHMGLRRALDEHWGGGAYGEVIAGGEIAPGDPVAWLDQS